MRTRTTRMTRMAIAVAGASAALILGGVPASGASGGTGDDAAVDVLVTHLDGEQEVPGPGDDDGHGTFAAVVRGDRLCYVLTAVRIETATAAHIHAAPAGVAGGIAVGLETPDRVGKGCITTVPDAQDTADTLSESELADILANPAGYYVNVHNARFPAGAIRGQLG
ncbi:CHRD domain-containing protein [Haloactinopolyspora alba]|uniref:CHRD domain-containing protein n=1 Tax=Haloactinopolyspora alba TaxID=648780 RepID=A0A2P8DY75_9ACTN|nr:CHRD domain-containing protein [Haloactinopolyspora alba]PSL02143.1 CHRD domain-containing protein [Haloactinopolyspora alba]